MVSYRIGKGKGKGKGMSVPYEIAVEVTHPEQLTRADLLGRYAHFSTIGDDSSERRMLTGIYVSLIWIKKTKDAFHYTFVIKSRLPRLGSCLRARRSHERTSAPQGVLSLARCALHMLRQLRTCTSSHAP